MSSNHRFAALTVNRKATINELSISKSSITQGTAITSGVTINTPAGFISTVSSTLVTHGSVSFAVTNGYVDASSLVLANVVNYAGTNGTPSVIVEDVTQGSFNITLRNSHVNNPLNGVVKIGYTVL